jgi:hypothetical protein
MTRHFFAFLALITGLLALNAPAHASYADAIACDTSVSASANVDAVSVLIPANAPPSTASQSTAAETPEPAQVQPAALRLPVLMGIERAYE